MVEMVKIHESNLIGIAVVGASHLVHLGSFECTLVDECSFHCIGNRIVLCLLQNMEQ